MIRPSLALVALFFYSICLGLSKTLTLILALPIFLMILWYKGQWKDFLKKLLFLNLFIALVVLSLLISNEKEHALLIFLRSNAIIAMALFLFHEKDAFAIAFGIQQLHAPKKLTSLFFFTAKFILLIKEEFNAFRQTLKTRGFKATTSIFTYQTYANFVGMLIIKALRRAQKLEHAMRLRGFNGELYTVNGTKAISKQEILFMVVIGVSIFFHLGALL